MSFDKLLVRAETGNALRARESYTDVKYNMIKSEVAKSGRW